MEGKMSDYIYKDKEGVVPLDYSRVENWVINANADLNTDFDLIFFCGTSVFQQTEENGVGSDPESFRNLGYQNFLICGSQLIENARVFCPVQRQLALEYALKYQSHNGLLIDIATKEPYIDLMAALDYYFENYNKGAKRPFVLAGHSQGAASLQVALAKYFLLTEKKDYLKNMIAAYALGYGVAKSYYDMLPNKEGLIHFAEGEDDYNCLISWNTEGIGNKGVSFLLADEGDETLVINPLNWKRDETYASIDENRGVLAGENKKDGSKRYSVSLLPDVLCDAQIDLKRGSVICSTRTDYVNVPGIGEGLWGGKSLHHLDGSGYYNNMKENLRKRVNNFLKHKGSEQK